MKSNMKHMFSEVPSAEIQRSRFDRSHSYKTTFDSSFLIPFFSDEVLPGDTFSLKASILARLSTPIVPIMDNLHLDTFFFFIPNRLLWDNWQKFNGEQVKPNDSTDFVVPTIISPVGGFAVGSIADYFGIPTGVAGLEVNALYFRAYNLIYNEWFRDQNLIDSLTVNTGDGPDSPTLYTVQRRGKRHDYFTSCLPWPQKGPGVEIPIVGNQAPVVYPAGTNPNVKPTFANSLTSTTYRMLGTTDSSPSFPLQVNTNGGASDTGSAGYTFLKRSDIVGGLYADLTEAGAATINDLRTAFQIQRLYERDARGGSRYVEILKAHFGVTSPDYRLQRPEFLGGSSSRININPVQQTSSSDTTSPQGNLAAFGLCADSFHGFTGSFTEHGIIIGLMNVWADLTYQQGLERRFTRQTRFDYYWPALAHLGEQPVLNQEIYAAGTSADDNVFGYQERYAEYRYKNSLITGKMRSTDAQTLDVWHLSQKFDACPTLSKDFIEEHVPLARALAVQTEPQFILDAFFDLSCTRPMPVYGTPGMIDHF